MTLTRDCWEQFKNEFPQLVNYQRYKAAKQLQKNLLAESPWKSLKRQLIFYYSLAKLKVFYELTSIV